MTDAADQVLHILMIEDSEDDALLIMRTLKKGGYKPDVWRVETAATLSQALHEKSWDIILCDYNLPDFNASAGGTLAGCRSACEKRTEVSHFVFGNPRRVWPARNDL